MPFDVLTLGPIEFNEFAVPEEMPLGGKQQHIVHNMPGGLRTVDVMGPDDHEVSWSGTFFRDDAFDMMLTLDAMRKSGLEWTFSWGAENRTVIIAEFEAKVVKRNVVKYDIKLVYTDDSTTLSGGFISFDAMVGADLSAALAIGP